MTINAIPWRANDNSERTVCRITIEKVSLINLGTLDRHMSDAELQEIEKTNVDVLFIPVGGSPSLSAEQAVKLITTLEPGMIIPIHFDLPNLKTKLASVDNFVKEIGLKPVREKKVIIKQGRIPKEDTEIVILSA